MKNAADPTELQAIYRRRFESSRAQRAAVWRVLTASFFQQFVGATDAVLDLGCGYGPIALTLARRAPEARVWAVDVNERALELVRENAAGAEAPNVIAVAPGEVPEDVGFAAIYSNPPVRVGKAALHELLLRWLSRLMDGGAAYLVVQKHLGSDSLARWLAESGYAVERLGSRMAYRLLEVRR